VVQDAGQTTRSTPARGRITDLAQLVNGELEVARHHPTHTCAQHARAESTGTSGGARGSHHQNNVERYQFFGRFPSHAMFVAPRQAQNAHITTARPGTKLPGVHRTRVRVGERGGRWWLGASRPLRSHRLATLSVSVFLAAIDCPHRARASGARLQQMGTGHVLLTSWTRR